MPTDTRKIKLPRRKRVQNPINWAAVCALIIVLTLAAYGLWSQIDNHIQREAIARADAEYMRDLAIAQENHYLRDANRELLCVLEGRCAMTVPGQKYDHLAEVTWHVARVDGR